MRKEYLYYSLMAGSGFLGLFKNIFLVKIIGLHDFGEYGFIVVLGSLIQLCIGLGTIEGLSIAVPYLHANNKNDKIAIILPIVFYSTMCRGLICIILFWYAMAGLGYAIYSYAPVLGLGTSLLSIPIILARSSGDIVFFGKCLFYKNLLSFIASTCLGIVYGLDGVLSGEFFGTISVAYWFYPHEYLNFNFLNLRYIYKTNRDLMVDGFPLVVQGINSVIQSNIERICIVAALGLIEAGKYSVILSLVTAANLVHAAIFQHIGAYALPKIASPSSSNRMIKKILIYVAIVGIILCFTILNIYQYLYSFIMLILPELGDFQNCFKLLLATLVVQLLNQFDWIFIGKAKQIYIRQISSQATLITLVLCVFGLIYKLPLSYFMIENFIVKFYCFFVAYKLAYAIYDKLRIENE